MRTLVSKSVVNKTAAAVAISVALINPGPTVSAGGITNLASEVTQWLNNFELLIIGIEAVNQVAMLINQYEQMEKNIKTVIDAGALLKSNPEIGSIGERVGDYMEVYRSVQQVRGDLMALKGNMTGITSMLDKRVKEMRALGMTPKSYFEAEAKRVGDRKKAASLLVGDLASSLDQNVKAMETVKRSFAQLASISNDGERSHTQLFQAMATNTVQFNAGLSRLNQLIGDQVLHQVGTEERQLAETEDAMDAMKKRHDRVVKERRDFREQVLRLPSK